MKVTKVVKRVWRGVQILLHRLYLKYVGLSAEKN